MGKDVFSIRESRGEKQKAKKRAKDLAACRTPSLRFTQLPLDSIFDSIREDFFPELESKVSFHFVQSSTLACVIVEDARALICIHDILNHSDTPKEVFSYIFKHELLHLIVPPKVEGGKETTHPEEFWEKEKAMCPERVDAWLWIYGNFLGFLNKRPKLERVEVGPGWKKMWFKSRLSLDECRESFPC